MIYFPVAEVLRRRHPESEWFLAFEVPSNSGAFPLRRFDAFAMSSFPSKDFRRIAYEFKISRSDWQRELANPDKRSLAVAIAHQFYIVAPRGIVAVSELPTECGLVEIDSLGQHKLAKRAPIRPADTPSLSFIAAFMGALARRGNFHGYPPPDW